MVGPRNKPFDSPTVKQELHRLITKHGGTRLCQLGHGSVRHAAAQPGMANIIQSARRIVWARVVFRKYGVQNNSIYEERKSVSYRVHRSVTGVNVNS